MSSFYAHRSWKCKIDSQVVSLFCTFGICMPFLYKSALCSFSLITVWLWLLWRKNIGAKAALKFWWNWLQCPNEINTFWACSQEFSVFFLSSPEIAISISALLFLNSAWKSMRVLLLSLSGQSINGEKKQQKTRQTIVTKKKTRNGWDSPRNGWNFWTLMDVIH